MSGGASLLEVVQALLERTYLMRTGVRDVGRFVIGDSGFRRLYGGASLATSAGAAILGRLAAKTLVRETADGVRACIYYPDGLIRCLEAHPPQDGLGEDNVDAFAVLVEELDHLLCIAERARESRPLTLFELELHANVSKYLVLARFLAGPGRPLDERRRTWLEYRLFHRDQEADEDVEVRSRYRDADRWAFRFLSALPSLRPSERIELVRHFHAAVAPAKLELIRDLGA